MAHSRIRLRKENAPVGYVLFTLVSEKWTSMLCSGTRGLFAHYMIVIPKTSVDVFAQKLRDVALTP